MSWRTTRATDAGAPGHHQVAIIDLGSNSWRLVVFSYGDGPWWKRTDELYETVRIGAGLESTGELGEQAMARGLETISVFGRVCRANRLAPPGVHPVAPSARRGIGSPVRGGGPPWGVTHRITEEIPTGRPAMSTTGPPVLPGLMAESV